MTRSHDHASLPDPARPSIANTAVALTIGFLASILIAGGYYILAGDLLSPSGPRTAVERELRVFEQAVERAPEDAEVHARYARALTGAKQFSQAEEVLDAAESVILGSPLLIVERARLEYAQGDTTAALATLANALDLVTTIRSQHAADLAERGIEGDFEMPEAEAVVEASLIEAAILESEGDLQGVIVALTRALDERPSMADILTRRGDAHLRVGDLNAARADFEAALIYAPDYEPALSGADEVGGDS